MPIKFEVGNIPVAKFVSRTVVDSFLAHFMITISDLPYSDILLSTDNHVCSHTGSWCMKISPYTSLEW